MMQFLDIEALKKDLTTDKLTPSEAYYYLLILCFTIVAIAVAAKYLFPPVYDRSLWDHVLDGANLIIPVLGSFAVFKLNKGGDNAQFAHNLVPIAAVLALRLLGSALIATAFLLGFYVSCIPSDTYEETHMMAVAPFIVMLSLYFVRLNKHMGDLNAD